MIGGAKSTAALLCCPCDPHPRRSDGVWMGETGPTRDILVGTKAGSRATRCYLDNLFSVFVLGGASPSVFS